MTRGRWLAWALFSIGLTAIVGQILLMRELLATLYGNELLFGVILAAWLGWGAAGAALALHGRRAAWRMRALATGLVAAALLMPAELVLARGLRTLLGATPGSTLDAAPLLLAVAVVPAPLCLCLGALFSIGARALVEDGGTPGQAYFWDSAGAAAGGVLFSFVFVRWLNPFQTAFLVAGFDLAVATLLIGLAVAQNTPAGVEPSLARSWLGASRARKASIPGIVVAAAIGTLVILVAAALPLGRAAQTATLALEWPAAQSGAAQSLLFSGDSPYGRLAVQANNSQRVFYTDGLLAFETQDTFPEEVAHLPLLALPAPRDVLLIGGGIAGDLREILRQPVDSVTYVELDPLLIRLARAYLPGPDAAILDDPRVHLAMTDGRAFVASQVSGRAEQAPGVYDAIILDVPEPTTGALNRFYTLEFFNQARALLRPGGILSFALPSSENYWNPELALRNASIYRTLKSAFPEIAVLPGEHDFFLASDRPIDTDPEILSRRLAERGVMTRWVTPGYLSGLLTGDRFAAAQQRVQSATGAAINRDLRPISYYYSLAEWLARFYPGLRQPFETASLINLWWVVIPMILLVSLARWRRAWRAGLAVALVGVAQMLVELVLLFAFQALHGSLYAEVGLLVTAFMAGLALGGAASNRIVALADRGSPIGDWSPDLTQATSDRGSATAIAKPIRRPSALVRRVLLGVLAGIAVYSVALPLLLTASTPRGGIPQLAFPVLALAGGALGGMVFPLASRLRMADGVWQMAHGPSLLENQSAVQHLQSTTPSRIDPGSGIANPRSAIGGVLYSLDLAGGCLGALVGVILFVPILGIPQTCAAIALLALAGLIAVL